MKSLHLILLIVTAGVLAGCKKEDNGRLDPSAMIALNAPKELATSQTIATKTNGEQQRITPRQIVEETTVISYHNYDINPDGGVIERGFNEQQRDLINNRLLMFGSDVINPYTNRVSSGFIDGCDFLLVTWRYKEDGSLWLNHTGSGEVIYDTVGYIPTAIVHDAAIKIRAAHAQGDYKTCYQLFHDAFTFYPITGKEWLELKANGKG